MCYYGTVRVGESMSESKSAAAAAGVVVAWGESGEGGVHEGRWDADTRAAVLEKVLPLPLSCELLQSLVSLSVCSALHRERACACAALQRPSRSHTRARVLLSQLHFRLRHPKPRFFVLPSASPSLNQLISATSVVRQGTPSLSLSLSCAAVSSCRLLSCK